jgi:hemolysin III
MDLKSPIPVLKLELVNSLIHGMGVLFCIIAMPALAVVAYKNENNLLLLAAGIYGFSFLMVFAFSTLYHGFQQPMVKETMKILDHISIYFLIAGTYTPFIFCYFNNSQGILMLKLLWVLVAVGIFFKTFFVNRFQFVSVLTYFLMGWILLWAGKKFFENMPTQVIALIFIGNFLYTVGVVFYLWKRWVYHHAYWHALVLLAAICHYTGILMAMQENA